jgi:hypothetical protein
MKQTKKATFRKRGLTTYALAVLASSQPFAQDYLKVPNNYVEQQTFKGQVFERDNNIWIYNNEFAKQFGMPGQWISSEISGIEAAAFRVEESTNAKVCGVGGKADQCLTGGKCMLDIYVDETKYPLPWREPQQSADWIKVYNSSNWLKKFEYVERSEHFEPSERGGGVMELRAFAHPKTNDQASYFITIDRNLKDPDKYGAMWGHLSVFGFKRMVVRNLSMISFSASCSRNFDPSVSQYLRLLPVDRSADLQEVPLHSAVLPISFTARMDELKANASANLINSVKAAIK